MTPNPSQAQKNLASGIVDAVAAIANIGPLQMAASEEFPAPDGQVAVLDVTFDQGSFRYSLDTDTDGDSATITVTAIAGTPMADYGGLKITVQGL